MLKSLGLRFSVLGLGCGFAFAGCAGDYQDYDVGSQSDDIINGTPGTDAQVRSNGWVRINHSGSGCSASILQNDLILTARHCVTTDGKINGPVDTNAANYTLFMGTETRTASEIIAHATMDVALIQLSSFFPDSGGKRFDWHRAIYSGTNASLDNLTLFCYGYGNNTAQCGPPAGGTGFGTIRTANLTVDSTSASSLVYLPNASGQIQWTGDSGGSCLSGSSITGVNSTCQCPAGGTSPTSCTQVGPETYRSWATGLLNGRPRAQVHGATSSTIVNNYTKISDTVLNMNGNANAVVQFTPNWNPGGSTGVYNNHHTGVWYDSSAQRWAVFNQDLAAMPVGADFNYSANATNSVRHTASSSNIVGHTTRLSITGANGNSNAILIVTPNWTSVYNNHATGVYYNSSDSRWYVYNEDFTAMPTGAQFNVWVVTPAMGAYVHKATASNTTGNYTYLDNANLNNQPNAQIFATHNWNPGGVGNTYNNHAFGVWYDTNAKKWAVFNQDLVAMPNTVAFNIHIRP